MDRLPNNVVGHFTYPGHLLEQVEANTVYVCGVCKTNGSGTRYRCNECAFDVHEYCRTYPESLSSFMHPHPLSRVVHNAQATRQNEPVCDVCGHHVEGLFYRCEDCDFNLHPVCSRLPQSLRHALHPAHPLTLQSSSSPCGLCAICRGWCGSWRYSCGACGFDIHKECVLVPCVPPTQLSVPPFNQPPPPQYGGSSHGMPSGYGPQGPPPSGGCGHEMPFRYSPPRPPPCCGYGHEMPFRYSPQGQPSCGGYGNGMPSGLLGPGYAQGMPSGYSPPPPSYGNGIPSGPPGPGYAQGMPSGYSPPPPSYGYGMPSGPPGPGYAQGMPSGYSPPSYGYGMPAGYSPINNGNHQTPTVGRITICQMFRIVSQLAIGVASNVIFGLIA